ncbi:MAG: hypothetical protein V1663_01625 [archaeon]
MNKDKENKETLEQQKDRIMNSLKKENNFYIYYGSLDLNQEYINWDHESEGEEGFFKAAKHVDSKIIYYFESKCEDKEDENNGKLEFFCFSFVYNGLIHTYLKYADFYKENQDDEDSENSENIDIEDTVED